MTGYKTIAFAALLFVLAIANAFGFDAFQMPADWRVWFDLIVPLVILALRTVTKTAIFKAE